MLELRVHLGRVLPAHAFTMHEIEVPDALLEVAVPESLPDGWERVPSSPATHQFGSAWRD